MQNRDSIWILLAFLLLNAFNTQAQPIDIPRPVLNNEDEQQTATAGFYSLQWNTTDSEAGVEYNFLVQEANTPSFDDARTIYSGTDLATTLSGKQDGTLYYRVRIVDNLAVSEWSNIHQVEVAHHSLQRAFFFLGLGAVVFLATTVAILRGHTQENASIPNTP